LVYFQTRFSVLTLIVIKFKQTHHRKFFKRHFILAISLSRNSILRFCLTAIFISGTSSFGKEPSCASSLKGKASRVFDLEVKKQLDRQPILKSWYILLFERNSIRDRILKDCHDGDECLEKNLAKAVETSFEKLDFSGSKRYFYLVAGIAGTSSLTAGTLALFNDNIDFFPAFTVAVFGQISLLTANLLAPFLEPISSRIRRATFALAQKNGSISPEHQSLERQADVVQATYTLCEQHATDRILSLRGALQFNLLVIRDLIQSGDREEIAHLLGDAAMLTYRHFRDLDPNEVTIVSAVRTSVLAAIDDPDEIYTQTMDYLIQQGNGLDSLRLAGPQNSGLSTDPAEYESDYYRRLLRAWLGLDVDLDK
jgi:hypothetical protein